MLEFFPFFSTLAAVMSAVLLVVRGSFGDLGLRSGLTLSLVFLLALYWQFLSGSVMLGALGLALQTVISVYLLIRSRVGT